MAAAATVAAAAAFTMVVAMIVVVTVTAAAAIVTMIVVVIVTMRAVHVTVLQLFSGRFADGDNFHIEFQVLPASMWLPSTTTWSSSTSVISTGTGP